MLLSALSSFAQGTAFMYQGSLVDNRNPANGVYDLTFSLYDSTNQPGNILGGTITNLATGISNGLFTTTLDFGNVFDGTGRWIQIGVRTNGAANFVTLIPRQTVTPVPYAIFAGTASNLVGALSTANLAPVTSLVAGASNGLYSTFATNATLTNPDMMASGNTSASATFTNDPYFFGGGIGLGFYGVGIGNTNDGGIQWSGPAGAYGFIDMIPNHDGNPAAPGRAELRIESANRIALIPNTYNDGDDGSIEIGLANGTKMYFNTMSNYNLPPYASGSGALVFRNVSRSNGVGEEFDPEIIGMWGTGSVTGGPNQFGSHLLICPDAGYGGYGGELPYGAPDVNKAIVGIDLAAGTNVAGTFYTSTELFGRNGTTTNSLRVDTNGITTAGLVNVTPDGSQLFAGESKQFQVGSGTQGTVSLWANGGTGLFEVFNGSRSPSNLLFAAGPGLTGGGGVNVFHNGLQIGPTGMVNTNSDDLELHGSGKYFGPTNVAPVFTASSSGLHTISLGSGWTNDFGQRADMVVDCVFQVGASAFCGFFFTNWVTGECYTNGCTMSVENTEHGQIIFPDISPGDHGGLTNLTSGGSVLTIVKGMWKLK